MSWSFQAVGKPSAVANAAKAAMEQKQCYEPEESYRIDCLGHIMSMSNQLVGQAAVKVSASGSMWKEGGTVKLHVIQLNFEPLHGFVE